MTVGVVNPGLDEIPRARESASEEALFRGYSRTPAPEPQTAPCVCTGTIAARSLADRDVFRAVQAHNESPRHAAWREREGIA